MEVNTWFVLAGGTLALMIAGGDHRPATLARGAARHAGQRARIPTDGAALMAFGERRRSRDARAPSRCRSSLLILAALAGAMIQHRLLFTTEPLTPKFVAHLAAWPASSAIFGKEALVQFVKGLVKMALVGAAMYMALWPERDAARIASSRWTCSRCCPRRATRR